MYKRDLNFINCNLQNNPFVLKKKAVFNKKIIFLFLSLLILIASVLLWFFFQNNINAFGASANTAVVKDWHRVQGEELYSYFDMEVGTISGFENFDFNQVEVLDSYGPESGYHCMDNWESHGHLPECERGSVCEVNINWKYNDKDYDYFYIKFIPPGGGVSVQNIGGDLVKVASPKGSLDLTKSSDVEWSYSNRNYSLGDNLAYEITDSKGNSDTVYLNLSDDQKAHARIDGLPVGTCTIKEKESSHGRNYTLNANTITTTISNNQVTYIDADQGLIDTPAYDQNSLCLIKQDNDTRISQNTQTSKASFENAIYEFEYFYDNFNILDISNYKNKHKLIKTWDMKTDKYGSVGICDLYRNNKSKGDDFFYNRQGNIVCPIGTYVVHEIKPAENYNLSDEYYIIQVTWFEGSKTKAQSHAYNAKTGQSLSNITIPQTQKSGFVALEKIIRADIEFDKQNEKSERLSKIPFKITSNTTGEWHVVVTNLNGQVNTQNSFNPHTVNTNYFDCLLDSSGSIPKTGIDETIIEKFYAVSGNRYGTWFCWDKINKKNISPKKDWGCSDVGAFPIDTYTLEEIPVSKTQHYELIKQTFQISKNNVCLDLGTLIDYEKVAQYIKTELNEKSTHTHYVTRTKECNIEDEVSYYGLLPYNEYTLVGTLKNEDGSDFIDSSNKSHAYKETFTPQSRNGTVTSQFCVDTSNLESGKKIICFETVLKDGLEIAKHQSLEDADQMVCVVSPKGAITTKAWAKSTNSNIANAIEDEYIYDRVSYANTEAGFNYVLKSELRDYDTGKVLTNQDGAEYTLETKFLTSNSYGQIDISFKCDTRNLRGKKIVVFEYLYDHTGALFDMHVDLFDQQQTVEVVSPSVSSKLYDSNLQEDKFDEARDNPILINRYTDLKIKDTLLYKKLMIGRTYSVKGYLINKLNNEAYINEVTNLPVEVNKTFVPEYENGFIDLTYEFDSTLIPNDTTLVSFVNIYDGDKKIATEEDSNNINQSFTVLKSDIDTNLFFTKNNKEDIQKTNCEYVDSLKLTNIPVNKKATVYNWLVHKKTGLPVCNNNISQEDAKNLLDNFIDSLGGSVYVSNNYIDPETHEFVYEPQWIIRFSGDYIKVKEQDYSKIDFDKFNNIAFTKRVLDVDNSSIDADILNEFDMSEVSPGELTAMTVVVSQNTVMAKSEDINNTNETITLKEKPQQPTDSEPTLLSVFENTKNTPKTGSLIIAAILIATSIISLTVFFLLRPKKRNYIVSGPFIKSI